MALDYTSMSIASYGESTLPKENKKVFEIKLINCVDDIDGARPLTTKIYKKPNFYDTSDVDGSKPLALHRNRNGPNNSLRVDDIDGAQAKIRDKMLLTKRCVNPMVPEYKLASFKQFHSEEPKFLRDTLNISDIDKAKPSKPVIFNIRDNLNVFDIVGAQANWRPKHEEARLKALPYEIMKVEDISKNTHRYVDKTLRSSNTLDPQYIFHGEKIEDDIKYTKPKPMPKLISDNHLLQTKDIDGAFSNFSTEKFQRREFKNTNYIHDIDGAQADTIKHSMVTKRCTHPLDKAYISLDGDILVSPVISLLPPTLIKQPTLTNHETKKEILINTTTTNNNNNNMDDTLTKHMKINSSRRESILPLTSDNISTKNSPRILLTAIDSAAYSAFSNNQNNIINVNIKDTNISKSTLNTPKESPRLLSKNTPRNLINNENNLINNNNNNNEAIAYSDKFLKTETLLIPTKESIKEIKENFNKPPIGNINIIKKNIPPLDLNMNNLNNNNYNGTLLNSNRSARSTKNSSRSNRISKADAELNEEINSVRSLY